MTTTTAPRRVWQRVPQGWIEFRSFGDATPDAWLEQYLRSGEGWLPDEARDAITTGFRAGVALFERTAFDFAGVSIVLGERPAVSFLCTLVVPAGEDAAADAQAFHRLFPVARFGDASTAETFTAPDGRVGTVSSGVVTAGGMRAVMTLGEIRLLGEAGTVLVLGMCSDPEQRMELAVQTAFALSTTLLLAAGEEPTLPGDLQRIPDAKSA